MGGLTICVRTIISTSSSSNTSVLDGVDKGVPHSLTDGEQRQFTCPRTEGEKRASTVLLQTSQEQGSGPDVVSGHKKTQDSSTQGLAKFLGTLLVD